MESAVDLDGFWAAMELGNTGRFAAFAVKMKIKPTKHKRISILYQRHVRHQLLLEKPFACLYQDWFAALISWLYLSAEQHSCARKSSMRRNTRG